MGRDWTLAEGLRDAARHLARRAPTAAVLWLVCSVVIYFFVRLGEGAGDVSHFMFLMAGVCTVAGIAVGLVLSGGLLEAVHFTGWELTLLACLVAVVIVVAVALLVSVFLPPSSDLFAALVPLMGSAGACAGVCRRTWAEA
jgi:hypothetical protein